MGVDAQDCLYVPQADECPLIGPHTLGPSRKAHFFRNFLYRHGLAALNTLQRSPVGQFTCTFDGRSAPKQIDYICASEGLRNRQFTCGARDTASTKSDHRPLIYRTSLLTQPILDNRVKLTRPKPIGWKLKDFSYASTISEALCDDPLPLNVDCQYSIFSDGSKKERAKRIKSAGWGFAAFHTPEPSKDTVPVVEAFGEVVTNPKANFFVGADRLTSCTGELSGAIEVALWLLGQSELFVDNALIPRGASVLIVFDATYVTGLLAGRFTPTHNVDMCKLLLHLWPMVTARFRVVVQWRRSHKGDIGLPVET